MTFEKNKIYFSLEKLIRDNKLEQIEEMKKQEDVSERKIYYLKIKVLI